MLQFEEQLFTFCEKQKKRRRFQWVTMMFGQATCEVDAK